MKLSKRFPLNALRVFEAAARLGSFTRAGEELGMTQTAVSYQIKLLEETTGEPLFLRRPRQILLTEAGEQLAPKVAEAFAMLQEAMASISGDAETTLRIHSTPTFASQWLARHVGSFQLKHPNIAVRLDTSASLIDFAREASDIAIRAGRGQWPGLRAHLLMKVYFTPMLSPALAETVGGIHEPADLLKLRIIDAGDPWWAQWFREAGVPDPGLQGRPRSRLGAQSFEASAALAGQGVAILTPEFYADDLASGRLIQPFDILSSDNTDYWIAYPENRRHTPRIRAFRDWILGEFGMPLE
ncbi:MULTISPECIES: LysR substrate-binding domain-containing protein [unclassified Rhizobium]|jgi:LysR family glycine cleavage system transcriptional activator|uniref:LysR substrate-binding domain-containing protein n=1 Tax=unclassified Rhizobium TaxID=2613769 RepID=UPI000DDDAC09|nr:MULTISPECIES: LysR substrate-binding domain-containing protein [unclassified Rhizobium]MBB3287778.1 LysR family glycine cleavage system transcriptional activator [Rhizobium sp. BK252]MBB3402618.1 LysR family glycine cleavage system transcriptional activator [Rhizobium sp. BK289]MBB3415194.1 LysR family glycine cleavage system transcriptional activator [Rhizobium sp. BK284]MBB3483083.1 LysR family glycine cleavage system transcriptional activator [Rhizobium sp. BK347]MDK4720708.1 LysR substr